MQAKENTYRSRSFSLALIIYIMNKKRGWEHEEDEREKFKSTLWEIFILIALFFVTYSGFIYASKIKKTFVVWIHSKNWRKKVYPIFGQKVFVMFSLAEVVRGFGIIKSSTGQLHEQCALWSFVIADIFIRNSVLYTTQLTLKFHNFTGLSIFYQ